MTVKPSHVRKETIYTYWESETGMYCPSCENKLRHEFNDGGREVRTLRGSIWIVTNYYSCVNPECKLHEAFPIAHGSTIKRKRHSIEVWSKVVQHHFKYHLNYRQIAEFLWDDWELSISESTVRNICQYFEMAGKQHANKEARKKVQENGRIILSLDGAQPIEGEPALWIFTDRLSDTVLLARLLESAPAEVLKEIYAEIEEKFCVPISGVISDKQLNIVNSVREFNPNIPHAYCHYHFLNHVMEPINSKDSHLRTTLKKAVRSFSLVQNAPADSSDRVISKKSPVAEIFAPVVEELKCAISTRGNRFDLLAGKEAFLNLKHVLRHLETYQLDALHGRVARSLRSLIQSLKNLLERSKPLYDELDILISEASWLRAILSHREWSGSRVKKWVERWLLVLHQRLEQASMTHDAGTLKWQYPCFTMSVHETYQQWIRLENSYCNGLYLAYDDPTLEFTNNAKEQLIHRTKAHFRALLGRQNVARSYQSRGSLYASLIDLDYSKEHVSSVLLASETPLIEINRREHEAQFAITKRRWRIRERETNNYQCFEMNLRQFQKNQ